MFTQASSVGVVAAIASWAEPWRSAFNHSRLISTGVLYVHLAALLFAGGFSLVADHGVLRGTRTNGVLDESPFAPCRRIATRALTVVFASGVALFLSDVEAYATLKTFWIKMGIVVVLVVNGTMCDTPKRQRLHSMASVALWLVAVGAGTALMNG